MTEPPMPSCSHPWTHMDSVERIGTGALPRVILVAAGLEILGGQGVQAVALVEGLQREGYAVSFLPINPRFPAGFRWLRHLRYVRTFFNQIFYLPSLMALRR